MIGGSSVPTRTWQGPLSPFFTQTCELSVMAFWTNGLPSSIGNMLTLTSLWLPDTRCVLFFQWVAYKYSRLQLPLVFGQHQNADLDMEQHSNGLYQQDSYECRHQLLWAIHEPRVYLPAQGAWTKMIWLTDCLFVHMATGHCNSSVFTASKISSKTPDTNITAVSKNCISCYLWGLERTIGHLWRMLTLCLNLCIMKVLHWKWLLHVVIHFNEIIELLHLCSGSFKTWCTSFYFVLQIKKLL